MNKERPWKLSVARGLPNLSLVANKRIALFFKVRQWLAAGLLPFLQTFIPPHFRVHWESWKKSSLKNGPLKKNLVKKGPLGKNPREKIPVFGRAFPTVWFIWDCGMSVKNIVGCVESWGGDQSIKNNKHCSVSFGKSSGHSVNREYFFRDLFSEDLIFGEPFS